MFINVYMPRHIILSLSEQFNVKAHPALFEGEGEEG